MILPVRGATTVTSDVTRHSHVEYTPRWHLKG